MRFYSGIWQFLGVLFLILFLPGCEAGELAQNIAGNKGAIIAITTVLAVLVGLIPGVGPVAIIITKIGTTLAQTLPVIVEALESDPYARTSDEAARIVVDKLQKESDNPVGKVPGAKLAAHIAAKRLIKKHRKKTAKKVMKIGNFLGGH